LKHLNIMFKNLKMIIARTLQLLPTKHSSIGLNWSISNMN